MCGQEVHILWLHLLITYDGSAEIVFVKLEEVDMSSTFINVSALGNCLTRIVMRTFYV